MGCDYQWESGTEWYSNLDKLLKHVNEDGRVIAIYSTPIEYTKAKNLEKTVVWPEKPVNDDYMTISQRVGSFFWAGYES